MWFLFVFDAFGFFQPYGFPNPYFLLLHLKGEIWKNVTVAYFHAVTMNGDWILKKGTTAL